MIGKFNDWLNEAAEPKRPPLYKVGDRVFASGDDVRVDTWNGWKHGWGKVLCEITEIDGKSGKWIYMMKIVAGYYNVYTSQRRGAEKISDAPIKAPQSNITVDGVEEVEKLIKSAKYKSRDNVAYTVKTAKGEINRSGQIIAIDIEDSLRRNMVCYAFKDVTNGVPQSQVEEDISVDEAKENLIAEEIAKMAGVEIKEFKEHRIDFEVISYDLSENIKGLMFFKDKEKLEKFMEEMQKLIDKHSDKILQLTMNDGSPSDIKVENRTTWRGGNIERKNLKNAAKNLKINLQELFQKFRGKLAGDKFGV